MAKLLRSADAGAGMGYEQFLETIDSRGRDEKHVAMKLYMCHCLFRACGFTEGPFDPRVITPREWKDGETARDRALRASLGAWYAWPKKGKVVPYSGKNPLITAQRVLEFDVHFSFLFLDQ